MKNYFLTLSVLQINHQTRNLMNESQQLVTYPVNNYGIFVFVLHFVIICCQEDTALMVRLRDADLVHKDIQQKELELFHLINAQVTGPNQSPVFEYKINVQNLEYKMTSSEAILIRLYICVAFLCVFRLYVISLIFLHLASKVILG